MYNNMIAIFLLIKATVPVTLEQTTSKNCDIRTVPFHIYMSFNCPLFKM